MNEESLFHEALARPSPRERAAFLDAACAGRPELRAAVEALLDAHGRPGEFLSAPPALAEGDGSAPDAGTENRAGPTDPDTGPSAAPPTVTLDRTGTAPPRSVEPPPRIGRYEIREQLGRGGMGTVYLAHDPELDRLVALKVPQVAGPAAAERFLREARAAAALDHPNLCRVHDAGRADGVLYLAMAYVPGRTLAEVVREDGPLPPERAAAVAAGVARGMAEAHRHGIVHRDLKPGNVLFDRHGEPVVTDFGLARRAGDYDASPATPAAAAEPALRLTQTGALMGTPAYMPPEQARGEHDAVGPAADVYALGAILFELLTGRPPFRGDSVGETLRMIETEPVPPMPGVPAALEAVCRTALAKDPAARFPSMEAFADALAAFAGARRRRRRRRTLLAAAAAVLLLAAGVVLYVKTDYGTIEVRLSDAAADVSVSVDGGEVTLTDGGRVVRLRPGPHELEVKGPGFETRTKVFRVTRGERTAVEVELKPKKAAGPDVGTDPPSDRARLATLIASGESLARQLRPGDIGPVADEALAIDPESPRALALRAVFRAFRNDRVGARADVAAALKLNPETVWALLVRGDLTAEEGKHAETVADATTALRLDPTNFVAWTYRARSYLFLKEYRQAVADATRAIEAGDPRIFPPAVRASAHAHLGEYAEALADQNRVAELSPNNPAVFATRSVLHAKMGNPEKAAADWATAKRLDPNLREGSRELLPDPPKPPERKKLTPEQSDALSAAMLAAEAALKEHRYADCLRECDAAGRIDPTSARPYSLRARALMITRQTAQALIAANEAIRLDPTDAWAYTARGGVKDRQKEPAAAIADHTIAITLDPRHASAWYNRGNAYYHRGEYHQALADVNEALRLGPRADYHATRGACHLHFGEYEKALADYAHAAESEPTNGRWWINCAILREKLGDPEGARKDRARATAAEPKYANAPPLDLPAVLPPVKKDPDPPPAEAPPNR